jgi:ketosteroid isomerase-like protein
MSPGAVDVVERVIAAVNARDVDGYLACCTEDVQLITPTSDVTGPYEGAQGIRRFFTDLDDANSSFRLDVERLEAVRADQVLVFVNGHASGRASGVPIEFQTGNVYDLVDGRIRRVRVIADRREALEAVGLAE